MEKDEIRNLSGLGKEKFPSGPLEEQLFRTNKTQRRIGGNNRHFFD